MFTILVVEDDAPLQRMMSAFLGLNGFSIVGAANGEEALNAIDRVMPDLVIADVMMPVMDGWELTRELRRCYPRLPIMLVTARDTIEDKRTGFTSGADDYLTKPFAIQELEARLRVLIRRERRQVGSEVLKVGDLVLDPASLRATRGGTELLLSPIGLKLLTILMRESPRVVSRQEIEREIWGNSLPDSDTLRSHLYNLRKVIDKPFDKQLLHTVQSAGYRIADIEQTPA